MASLFPPPPGARGILVFSLVFSSLSFLTHCVAGLGSGPQGSSAPGTRQDLGSLGAVTSGMALAPGIRRPGLLPGCTGRAQPRPTWSRCQQSRHWESLVLRLEGLVQPCTEQAHRLQPESGLQARGEKGGSVPLCACPVRVHPHTHVQIQTPHTETFRHRHIHTNTLMHIYTYTSTHSGTHKTHTYTEAFRHKRAQTHRCTHTHKYTQTPPAPTHTTSGVGHEVSRNGPSSVLLGQTPGKLGTQRRAGGQPGLRCGHLAAGQGSDRPGGGRLFLGGPFWREWVCSTRLLLG